MIATLYESTFRQLRDFIYERTGIFVPDTKKYLIENRLAKRIEARNLKTFEDYYLFVTHGSGHDELTRLFDAVTTNETYFFREPQQLDVFTSDIVPAVLETKPAKDLRVWSAACSTGEEPYNIVMLLKEKCHATRCEVIGSDLSETVIDSARKAVFTSYSVRNVPEQYLKKYFRQNGAGYEIDSAIRSAVAFKRLNLVDERAMRAMRYMDIVFCRNVLIYFDDKAKQRVVSYLYDSLNPGGYLFVGASESLHNVTRAFRPVIVNKVVVYQKS